MRTCIAVLAVAVACPVSAQADEPWLLFDGYRWALPSPREQWHQRCWYPDDYCPKLRPAVVPNPVGCVNDYCRKSAPPSPPCVGGGSDDYCPRRCPLWLFPLEAAWQRCAPLAPHWIKNGAIRHSPGGQGR